MSEHQCFTVSTTAYIRGLSAKERREECFAVHYQKPPRKNEDVSTSLSLNFPTLIVTAYLEDQEKIAQRVADILNKHWDDAE